LTAAVVGRLLAAIGPYGAEIIGPPLLATGHDRDDPATPT
jgi:hypothetical protein